MPPFKNANGYLLTLTVGYRSPPKPDYRALKVGFFFYAGSGSSLRMVWPGNELTRPGRHWMRAGLLPTVDPNWSHEHHASLLPSGCSSRRELPIGGASPPSSTLITGRPVCYPDRYIDKQKRDPSGKRKVTTAVPLSLSTTAATRPHALRPPDLDREGAGPQVTHRADSERTACPCGAEGRVCRRRVKNDPFGDQASHQDPGRHLQGSVCQAHCALKCTIA